MRIILSPAKKMKIDTDSLPCQALPHFLPQTEQLLQVLRTLSYPQAKSLWNCNDSIAQTNYQRLQNAHLTKNTTPAILSYEGIQYQYMAPGVFEESHYQYIQTHLRIVSGFYGILRPFDGVVPYRLEMQAKLQVQGYKNLYEFWGSSLANHLAKETKVILNLASKEYSKAITRHLPPEIQFVNCTFSEWQNGKLVEKGTLCKMARGEMVRFMAEHQVKTLKQIQAFNLLGYTFSPEHSQPNHYIFIKGDASPC